jgi:hypothetical protein
MLGDIIFGLLAVAMIVGAYFIGREHGKPDEVDEIPQGYGNNADDCDE